MDPKKTCYVLGFENPLTSSIKPKIYNWKSLTPRKPFFCSFACIRKTGNQHCDDGNVKELYKSFDDDSKLLCSRLSWASPMLLLAVVQLKWVLAGASTGGKKEEEQMQKKVLLVYREVGNFPNGRRQRVPLDLPQNLFLPPKKKSNEVWTTIQHLCRPT